MDKRHIPFFVVIAICVVIFIGYETTKSNAQTNVTTDPEQYSTPYVGDNSKVIGVVSNLSYPQGYSYESIEIQSSTEPYGLTVYLTVGETADAVSETDLQEDADKTFELIGNLGTLEYKNSQTKELLASFSRE